MCSPAATMPPLPCSRHSVGLASTGQLCNDQFVECSIAKEFAVLYSVQYASPLGAITLAGDGENLTILKFEQHRFFAEATKDCQEGTWSVPALGAAKQWLDAYFSGKKPAIAHLPLAPAGSVFRQAVWGILREIPYGHCMSYGEIAGMLAERMGKPRMSARAVGGAVGHNPLSIIIPCHRVVGSNGNLTGYGGGMSTKVRLLTHEGLDMSKFTIPTRGTAL